MLISDTVSNSGDKKRTSYPLIRVMSSRRCQRTLLSTLVTLLWREDRLGGTIIENDSQRGPYFILSIT